MQVERLSTCEVRSNEISGRGTSVADLPTPSLLMDLDGMEGNLQTMAAFIRSGGPKLRPHFKAHQVFALAKKQIEHGAIGLTCARIDHAEALVEQGISNILIANEIAGENKIRRFVELARQASVIIAVDNAKVVDDMARIAGPRADLLNVLVDVDVRLGRCGVKPGDAALRLTKQIIERQMRFRGLMGYEGQVAFVPGPEKDIVAHDSLKRLIDTKTMIEGAGIPVEIVSCGGSSDFSIAGRYPLVTEIQAGSYLLMDSTYALFAPEFNPTLTVLATVISKTPGERIVVDAGFRAMSGKNGLPSLKSAPKLRVKALHIEHTVIEITDSSVPLDVGDKLEIWVSFLDQTLGLHDFVYGIRDGKVQEVLKIEH